MGVGKCDSTDRGRESSAPSRFVIRIVYCCIRLQNRTLTGSAAIIVAYHKNVEFPIKIPVLQNARQCGNAGTGTDKLVMLSDNYLMSKSASLYKRHRFPPEIIQYAVWLYYRFNLSQRDIEDLLAERGIIVSYESIRLWCNKFGPAYSRRLKRRHKGFGDTFYIDEVFVNIRGKRHYLW